MAAAIDPFTQPQLSDTVTIELASSTSPYTKLYSVSSVIDTGGHGTFAFAQNLAGSSYYIVVRHRNALETWSAAPVLFSAVTGYDFTTAPTQAFGSNMIQAFDLPLWCLYSGDISDAGLGVIGVQDAVIESQDYLDMENAVSAITVGYTPVDLTGDGVVESGDYTIMENNVSSIIFSVHP